jgi:hypothetical protein
MGIETLHTAARAAGFAMAASDEVAEEKKAEAKVETESWSSGDAVLTAADTPVAKAVPSTAEWLKSLLGMSGRRAPA